MKFTLLLIVVAGLLTGCTEQTAPMKQSTTHQSFKAGQIWKYDNRPGEDHSLLTILKVEQYEQADSIIHIRVDDVKIYSPGSPGGYIDHIGHLPFSEKSLAASVTTLVGTKDTIPDFAEGYGQWKEAWDSGKAGCWAISVREAVDGIDKSMQQSRQQQ